MASARHHQHERAGQTERGQVAGGGAPTARVAVEGVHDAAFDGHEQRAQPLQQHGERVALGEKRDVGRARARDAEHVAERGQQQHAGERTAHAALEHRAHDAAQAARALPVRAEEAEDEVQRAQQRGAEHEVVVGQRVEAAAQRQQARPGMIAHRVLDTVKQQREEGDDLREVVKLRVDHGEGGKDVEHAAQQREAVVPDHPAQVEERAQRADGVLEHGHDADAEGDERLGQQRQRPDERAAQRVERIAAHGRRAQERRKAVALHAAQDAPGFQEEGELLLDEVAPGHEAPAVGDDGRAEGEKGQQRAEKKRVGRAGAPRPRGENCFHDAPFVME